MKLGVISLLVSLIGLAYGIWLNYSIYLFHEAHYEAMMLGLGTDMSPRLVVSPPQLKIYGLILAFVGIVIGVLAIRAGNKKQGIIGVICSIITLLISIFPIGMLFLKP